MNIADFYGRLMRKSKSEPTEFIDVAKIVRRIAERSVEAIMIPSAVA